MFYLVGLKGLNIRRLCTRTAGSLVLVPDAWLHRVFSGPCIREEKYASSLLKTLWPGQTLQTEEKLIVGVIHRAADRLDLLHFSTLSMNPVSFTLLAALNNNVQRCVKLNPVRVKLSDECCTPQTLQAISNDYLCPNLQGSSTAATSPASSRRFGVNKAPPERLVSNTKTRRKERTYQECTLQVLQHSLPASWKKIDSSHRRP